MQHSIVVLELATVQVQIIEDYSVATSRLRTKSEKAGSKVSLQKSRLACPWIFSPPMQNIPSNHPQPQPFELSGQ